MLYFYIFLTLIIFIIYGTFAIKRKETVRKNQIYFYMPNMFFILKYVQI